MAWSQKFRKSEISLGTGDGKTQTTIYQICKIWLNYLIWLEKSHESNNNFLRAIQSWSANFQTKLQSDPVLIRSKLASVLIQFDVVLIRVHLWCVVLVFFVFCSVATAVFFH